VPGARITGAAFFDSSTARQSVASNGIELHPILNVACL
jgi:hypothetical protein